MNHDFPRYQLFCGLLLSLACGRALADVPVDATPAEIWADAKQEFDEKFAEFKKGGLSAEQVEELTDKLLEHTDGKIEGTGAEFLLKTLNTQAKNVKGIMEKKENAANLIDFIGDVYALSQSETAPDSVEAYKALTKGVKLSSKLASKIPVLGEVAGPMIEAYAQAMENGLVHVEAIAEASKKKNAIIDLGYDELPYEEVLEALRLEREKPEPLTEEELAIKKLEAREKALAEACLKYCQAEYDAFHEAMMADIDAHSAARTARKKLTTAKRDENRARNRFNDKLKQLDKSRLGYTTALQAYRKAVARLKKQQDELARTKAQLASTKDKVTRAGLEAKALSFQAAIKVQRELVDREVAKLARAKESIKREWDEARKLQEQLLDARVATAKAKAEFDGKNALYAASQERYLAARKVLDDCMKRCEDEEFGDATKTGLLETITVPTCGSAVKSTTVLESGVTYEIRASGTFSIGGPGDHLGDAEYADFSKGSASAFDKCNYGSGTDFGIAINDPSNGNTKATNWGGFSADHQYSVSFTGAGAPISLNYHDCNHGDNAGSLTVQIWRPE